MGEKWLQNSPFIQFFSGSKKFFKVLWAGLTNQRDIFIVTPLGVPAKPCSFVPVILRCSYFSQSTWCLIPQQSHNKRQTNHHMKEPSERMAGESRKLDQLCWSQLFAIKALPQKPAVDLAGNLPTHATGYAEGWQRPTHTPMGPTPAYPTHNLHGFQNPWQSLSLWAQWMW